MTTSTVIIIVAVIAALLIGFIALVAYGSSQDEKAREQYQQKVNAFNKEFDVFMDKWNWKDDPDCEWRSKHCTVKKNTRMLETTFGDLFEGLKPMLDKYAGTELNPYRFRSIVYLPITDNEKSDDKDKDNRPLRLFENACAQYIKRKRAELEAGKVKWNEYLDGHQKA